MTDPRPARPALPPESIHRMYRRGHVGPHTETMIDGAWLPISVIAELVPADVCPPYGPISAQIGYPLTLATETVR